MTIKQIILTTLAFLALSVTLPAEPVSGECEACSGGQGSGSCVKTPPLLFEECDALGGVCIHWGDPCEEFAMAVDGTLSSLSRFALAKSPGLAETVDDGTVLRRTCDQGVLARAYSVERHDEIRTDTRHLAL